MRVPSHGSFIVLHTSGKTIESEASLKAHHDSLRASVGRPIRTAHLTLPAVLLQSAGEDVVVALEPAFDVQPGGRARSPLGLRRV